MGAVAAGAVAAVVVSTAAAVVLTTAAVVSTAVAEDQGQPLVGLLVGSGRDRTPNIVCRNVPGEPWYQFWSIKASLTIT